MLLCHTHFHVAGSICCLILKTNYKHWNYYGRYERLGVPGSCPFCPAFAPTLPHCKGTWANALRECKYRAINIISVSRRWYTSTTILCLAYATHGHRPAMYECITRISIARLSGASVLRVYLYCRRTFYSAKRSAVRARLDGFGYREAAVLSQ